MTIRTKLALWFGLLLTVILVILMGLRHAAHQQILFSQKDYSLKVIASILDASLPRPELSTRAVQSAVTRIYAAYPDIELGGMIIEVYDHSRALVFSSSLTPGERLPLPDDLVGPSLPKEGQLITIPGDKDAHPLRVLTKPIFKKHELIGMIQVGASTQDIYSILENSLWLNFLFIPTAVLLVSLGGWLLAAQALKPLYAVIRTAHQISSGDLSHRIEPTQSSEEIRELTVAFNQMISRLDHSFRNIRDFSDNVSHELRIPLSILRGQTELSLRRARSREEYRDVLKSNLEEIIRMEKIVERLFFLSRASRGEVELKKTRVDLHKLMEQVRRQFDLLSRERKIEIRLQSNGPLFIEGDEVLLRELMLNLVQNAVNFTPEGGQVALSLEGDPNRARMAVADTGPGIPPEEIPRIFERFYQVDRSRASQGSGLGLSICRWIVEAHRGSIAIESHVGRGSKFTVTLPLKD